MKENIYQKIDKVMGEVSFIHKDLTVNFKNVNYKGISHDMVVAKLREPIRKAGIVCIPSVISHEHDGNCCKVLLATDFVNRDDPTDKITIQSLGYGIDTQDKGPGKAVSYATKYAFLKLFMLETGDDPERDSFDYQASQEGFSGFRHSGPLKGLNLDQPNLEQLTNFAKKYHTKLTEEEKKQIRARIDTLKEDIA